MGIVAVNYADDDRAFSSHQRGWHAEWKSNFRGRKMLLFVNPRISKETRDEWWKEEQLFAKKNLEGGSLEICFKTNIGEDRRRGSDIFRSV